MSTTNTISGVAGDMVGDLGEQLWILAPIGLAVAAIIWGVPKGVGFVKKLVK